MKYLTTTFAIAFMAIGFAATMLGIVGIVFMAAPTPNPAYANASDTSVQDWMYCRDSKGGKHYNPRTYRCEPRGETASDRACDVECVRRREQQSSIDLLDPLEQFADKEDGVDGGESGGDDFGEGDRAAASTAAE